MSQVAGDHGGGFSGRRNFQERNVVGVRQCYSKRAGTDVQAGSLKIVQEGAHVLGSKAKAWSPQNLLVLRHDPIVKNRLQITCQDQVQDPSRLAFGAEKR